MEAVAAGVMWKLLTMLTTGIAIILGWMWKREDRRVSKIEETIDDLEATVIRLESQKMDRDQMLDLIDKTVERYTMLTQEKNALRDEVIKAKLDAIIERLIKLEK